MTTKEITQKVTEKFGSAAGTFSVRASGVWLKDGVIEIDTVEAGFQSTFYKAINVDVEIPMIEAETDEAAEAALKAKLAEIFPDAENVWISIM